MLGTHETPEAVQKELSITPQAIFGNLEVLLRKLFLESWCRPRATMSPGQSSRERSASFITKQALGKEVLQTEAAYAQRLFKCTSTKRCCFVFRVRRNERPLSLQVRATDQWV